MLQKGYINNQGQNNRQGRKSQKEDVPYAAGHICGVTRILEEQRAAIFFISRILYDPLEKRSVEVDSYLVKGLAATLDAIGYRMEDEIEGAQDSLQLLRNFSDKHRL